ncbi:MAG: TraB/GumN family protein, partial [Candidatus Kapaibacterium sp.]
MKKIRQLLLFTLASLIAVSCSVLKTENTEETFLWKVDDGNSHIFLLGSIHVAKPDMYPLDYRIEEAY